MEQMELICCSRCGKEKQIIKTYIGFRGYVSLCKNCSEEGEEK